jgi:hypothetical protein
VRSVTGVEPNTPLSAKAASLRGDVLAILVLFLLALTIRVTLAFKDIASIDRLFLPDDTYYSLAIARNLAHGHGPTADGFILTNGFQPLVTFLNRSSFAFLRFRIKRSAAQYSPPPSSDLSTLRR